MFVAISDKTFMLRPRKHGRVHGMRGTLVNKPLVLTPSGSQWVFIQGGCSRRGVQWIGVVSYNKLVYDITSITTPCFHCTPLR